MVEFAIRMIVDSPFGAERTRVAHGSPPEALLPEAGVALAATNVAIATGVSVGRGVKVGVSVDGTSVAVGMAA